MIGGRLADLTSPQVAELLAGPEVVVALLPIGAVEAHGPHAPLGTDTLISDGVCRRAVAEMNADPAVRVLVLPALAYGVTRCAEAFPGTISVGEATLENLVVDVCLSVAGQGLGRVAIVNNHFEPAHVAALRRAVETLNRGGGARVGLLDLTRRANAARLTAEFRSGSCHAGSYETSLILAETPDLVDKERMAGLSPHHVDMPSALASGARDFAAMGMTEAYCGAPAEATGSEGDATFATLTEMLVALVRELAVE